jgi:dGTPase
MAAVLPEQDTFAARRHQGDRPDRYRSPYERDCDRLLYCSAFRRLSGVTQVVSADETLLFHNRLTHTLKVAQIARSLSDRLCRDFADRLRNADGLDAGASVAAAMAHDLGHPPFGHIAEDVLRDLCDGIDSERSGDRDSALGVTSADHNDSGNGGVDINGYEGNAQSFRIVTRLSWRIDKPGLNLTRRTLRGILKYPWERIEAHAQDKKWGAYASEHSDFIWAEELSPGQPTSLEAEIMDWADDITYAVHDLEDFYRAGLTPIARLHSDSLEQQRFVAKTTASLGRYNRFVPTEAAAAFSAMMELIPFERPYEGTNSDRRRVHEAASTLITRFIEETKLGSDGRSLDIPRTIWHEVNVLKQLTWHYVINSPDLATIQEGQKAVVRHLFTSLTAWAKRERSAERLPTRFREIMSAIQEDDEARSALDDDPDKIRSRAACDYIASLTEVQAIELHGRFIGQSKSSIMQGWVRT